MKPLAVSAKVGNQRIAEQLYRGGVIFYMPVVWTVLAVVLMPWSLNAAPASAKTGMQQMTLRLTSSSFSDHGEIPSRHTCEGADISPSLAWTGAPEGAKSFVLIVDDPDAPDPKAPQMTWVHWVLYDLPSETSGLAEGAASSVLPGGTREGLNDWKRTGYGGPCPPIGRHRYFHKLYALDTVLGDLGQPTKAELERAMADHVLAHAELIGTYEKKAR